MRKIVNTDVANKECLTALLRSDVNRRVRSIVVGENFILKFILPDPELQYVYIAFANKSFINFEAIHTHLHLLK